MIERNAGLDALSRVEMDKITKRFGVRGRGTITNLIYTPTSFTRKHKFWSGNRFMDIGLIDKLRLTAFNEFGTIIDKVIFILR